MMLELSTTNSQFADFAVRDLVSLESHETFCRDPGHGAKSRCLSTLHFVEFVDGNNYR